METVTKICPKCDTEFDAPVKGYSKKFCSLPCANARIWSDDAMAKRMESIKRAKALFTDEKKAEILKRQIASYQETCRQKLRDTPTHELGRDGIRKKLFEEQNGECLECDITEWNGKPIILELDHIDGDNDNNRRENLRMLCPNCHSQTPTWKIGKQRLSKLTE